MARPVYLNERTMAILEPSGELVPRADRSLYGRYLIAVAESEE
jgi:hypothetical protein